MSNFFNLVQNENLKIYSRPRTYVMAAILFVAVLMFSILWIAVSGNDTSMWDVIYVEFSILFFAVTVFSVVIAAGSVAEEFSTGTIKLLLIRPWTRSKILLSKYAAVLQFYVLAMLYLMLILLVINGLLFGISSSSIEPTMFDTTKTSEVIMHTLQVMFLTWLPHIVTITLSFLISAIFRSSSLAIGLSLFILLILNNFKVILALLPYKWIDYVLFLHLNLSMYVDGNIIREGFSLGFSLAVLAAYYIVFVALTWYVFKRRDISS